MATFREFLAANSHPATEVNIMCEVAISPETDLELRKKAVRRSRIELFVTPDGKITVGSPYGEHDKFYTAPSFEITPATAWMRVRNLEPTTRQFKDVIYALKKYFPNIEDWDVEILNLSHADTGWRSKTKYYRKVRYYLEQPASDFNEKRHLPAFLYHGTSSELWFDGIKQKGLLPRGKTGLGLAGSYGAGNAISHDDKVYLSVHPDAACRGAARQASATHGGTPLILRISTEGLFPERFTGDEDAKERYKQEKEQRHDKGIRDPDFTSVSVSHMGTVAYAGRIPPILIQPFLVAKLDGVHIIGWKRWTEETPRDEHPLTKTVNSGREIFSNDSPYVYALIDAGVLDKDKKPLQKIDDAEMRRIIRSSPWSLDAAAIVKDLSNWGMDGLKSLNYVRPSEIQEPQLKTFVKMLVNAGIYYDRDDFLTLNSWDTVPKAIALAKHLYAVGLSLKDLMAGLPLLRKYQK